MRWTNTPPVKMWSKSLLHMEAEKILKAIEGWVRTNAES